MSMDQHRVKRRKVSELEHWLTLRGVTSEEAVREACAYAASVDELLAAPKEDLEWLTEAWESTMRERFLYVIDSERASYEEDLRGTEGDGSREHQVDNLDRLVEVTRATEGAGDDWRGATLGRAGGEPADEDVARLLTSIPGGEAPAAGAARAPAAAANSGTRNRSEAQRSTVPRFRMSILTDYAGTVSETVTDERIPDLGEAELARDDALQLEFKSLLNFDKVGRGEQKRCVMCGRTAEAEDRREGGCQPETCVIPKQCKDVCDACTKSTWHHRSTGTYFKWCQGCKKFRAIGAFANKRHTAKCDSCRKRGRQGYHNKVKARESAGAPGAPQTADFAGIPAPPPDANADV